MAEETTSSIEAPKPPVVNPIAGSDSTRAATLKLKPVIRKPVIGGAKPAFKCLQSPLRERLRHLLPLFPRLLQLQLLPPRRSSSCSPLPRS